MNGVVEKHIHTKEKECGEFECLFMSGKSRKAYKTSVDINTSQKQQIKLSTNRNSMLQVL